MSEDNEKMTGYALIAIFALLTYLFVYILSNYGLRWLGTYDWRFESATISPLYALMPFIGFCLVFYGLAYWKKNFAEERQILAILLVIFLIGSLFAFWINLWFFYHSTVDKEFGFIRKVFQQARRTPPEFRYDVCMFGCRVHSGMQCISRIQFANNMTACTHYQLNFWSEFFRSAFFVFWLSGLFAGLSFLAYDKIAAMMEADRRQRHK